MAINDTFDKEDLVKANEWWENLPAVTKIAIYQDLWDINEFDD